MSKIKVVLIGAGGWGAQHARIFAARPNVDLCAIVGRTPDKTQQRAERYGVRAYTDIAMMLSKERPDLVSLCLPNQGHFETTLQVIQAGYPLLVEKPLVFDVGEAETLIEEAAKRNQPPPIHARVGLRALKLAYVAIESFERGVRVML